MVLIVILMKLLSMLTIKNTKDLGVEVEAGVCFNLMLGRMILQ